MSGDDDDDDSTIAYHMHFQCQEEKIAQERKEKK